MKIVRWIALLIIAMIGFSQYYVYNSLTSIDSLLRSYLDIDSTSFGLLYSFYSVANVFLGVLFFAGVLVDYWGYQKAGLLFVTLCLLGSFLTAYGASPQFKNASFLPSFFPSYSPQLKIMLLGRMIFGVGAEALIIAMMKAISAWFGKKKVALAFALALVLYRFGNFTALNVQVKIAEKYGVLSALYMAVAVMGVGVVCYIIYLIIDAVFHSSQEEAVEKGHKFKFSNIAKFPISFWYITLICVTYYGVVISFEIFNPDILKEKFGLSLAESGFLSSMFIVATMVSMPVIGKLIDHYGRRATVMVWGTLLAFFALLWVACMPYVGVAIFILGIAYSLLATALWPTIPVIIHRENQGSAFGILSYIQNVGLMLFPWISGYIADLYTTTKEGVKHINYLPMLGFFLGVLVIACIFAVLLRISDRKSIRKGLPSIEHLKES